MQHEYESVILRVLELGLVVNQAVDRLYGKRNSMYNHRAIPNRGLVLKTHEKDQFKETFLELRDSVAHVSLF